MCKFEGSSEMCSNYGLVQAPECLAKHTVSLFQAIVTSNAALATSGQQQCDGIRKNITFQQSSFLRTRLRL